MALFFNGLILSHYNSFNLSSTSQVTAEAIFSSMAQLSEFFVYLYMGMGVFTGRFKAWSPLFAVIALAACMLARMFNIFPFSCLANLGRHRKITGGMQVVMWFAGLRGAISFALSQSMPGSSKDVYSSTTLMIVVFTTMFCGGLTEPLMNRMNVKVQRSSGAGSKSRSRGAHAHSTTTTAGGATAGAAARAAAVPAGGSERSDSATPVAAGHRGNSASNGGSYSDTVGLLASSKKRHSSSNMLSNSSCSSADDELSNRRDPLDRAERDSSRRHQRGHRQRAAAAAAAALADSSDSSSSSSDGAARHFALRSSRQQQLLHSSSSNGGVSGGRRASYAASASVLADRVRGGAHGLWEQLDANYLKPLFGGGSSSKHTQSRERHRRHRKSARSEQQQQHSSRYSNRDEASRARSLPQHNRLELVQLNTEHKSVSSKQKAAAPLSASRRVSISPTITM
jgi:Sodium/hydrogen exchanger family